MAEGGRNSEAKKMKPRATRQKFWGIEEIEK